jgi:hypothetical protein
VHVIQTGENSASVLFAEAELVLINNALNEVLTGLNLPEFETRLGASRQEAEELLHRVSLILSKME